MELGRATVLSASSAMSERPPFGRLGPAPPWSLPSLLPSCQPLPCLLRGPEERAEQG